MSYRKEILLLMLAMIIFFGIGLFFGFSEEVGLCKYSDGTCYRFYGYVIAQPLIFFSTAIFLVCAILLITKEKVYRSWKKFAIFAIPVCIFLLIIAPSSTSGGFGISGKDDFTRETASWGVPIMFIAISLVIIIVKSFRHKT